ncbi:MAG: sigma-70 family RNA polymerase sigma factor [Actinomycetota bacterium]
MAREHSGRVLALLAKRFNDLDLADEAVQDGLVRAADRWPTDGIPDNPGGWLMTVARNRAIDLLRRRAARERATDALRAIPPGADEPTPATDDFDMDLDHTPDERLRLLLLCCHPALARDAQVALTLRLVAGVSTDEIASAYLTPVPTIAARITRAKKKIRVAGIPMSMPDELQPRLGAVLQVIYLMFNEGYLSRSGAHGATRVDLCEESIRLADVLISLRPDDPEVVALRALMGFVHARRDARFDGDRLITLDQQDRTRWHRAEIAAANRTIATAMAHRQPGPFQFQALIAAYHSTAPDAASVDWSRIVALYDQYVAFDPSPVVRLNRAAAIGHADGPDAGWAALADVDGLDGYHLYWATRAEFAARTGRSAEAIDAYDRALNLTTNPAEQTHLEQRRARLRT